MTHLEALLSRCAGILTYTLLSDRASSADEGREVQGKEKMVVEPYSLLAGVPAKFIRQLTEETYQTNLKWAEKYTKQAVLHRSKGFAQE